MITLQLGIQKKLYKTLDNWYRDTLNFDFLIKGSGNSFFTKFCVWTFTKNVSYNILLTKFHFLIAFTSWDIGQYWHHNCCWWASLWCQKFWNQAYLSKGVPTKPFHHASWIESLKKGKVVTKPFFRITMNEVPNSCEEMISADVKANATQ